MLDQDGDACKCLQLSLQTNLCLETSFLLKLGGLIYNFKADWYAGIVFFNLFLLNLILKFMQTV